jgi:hypothetical protein
MNKLNRLSKIFLFLFVSSGVIWLGGYITRLSLFYQLFQAAEFVLKEFVTDQNISGIFQTLIAAVSINLISYLFMIICFILFVITSKLSLKQNGWLFIALILILLTAPFELYLMWIDYKIVIQVFSGNFDSKDILNLVIKRFTILNSFPIVEILSYGAVIYLFLFQPLSNPRIRLLE